MISSFSEKSAALEAEGVYIGSWSAKNVLSPRKDTQGEYGEPSQLFSLDFLAD
jgi:hypothetical protein